MPQAQLPHGQRRYRLEAGEDESTPQLAFSEVRTFCLQLTREHLRSAFCGIGIVTGFGLVIISEVGIAGVPGT